MTDMQTIQKQIDQLKEHLETRPLLEKRKRVRDIEKLMEKQRMILQREAAKKQGRLFGNY